ncbi:glycoside hydrolase family 125 protein [Streptomyces sp. NPDC058818]|uniref:glycoside hydrolase family 125 protein n=1 Tax=Streptomyces sp. NPDC058818 TaxID=3346640 RepID=UPI0036B810BA
MHESFHKDDPRRFTRPWFSWANAMYAELALDIAELGTRPMWASPPPTSQTAVEGQGADLPL